MNLTNFKIASETMGGEKSIRSMHIDRAHIVAIFETKDGTSIYTTGGHIFNVPEDVDSVRKHLYSPDFWPETYRTDAQEQKYVRWRKPYSYVPA